MLAAPERVNGTPEGGQDGSMNRADANA
jgi:hypothetical protein